MEDSLIDVRYLSNLVLLPASNQFRDHIVADVRAALARAHYFNMKDEQAVKIVEWNRFLTAGPERSQGIDSGICAQTDLGGHEVSTPDVLRRFGQGWTNFVGFYRPLADAWAVYDNSGQPLS